MQSPRCGANRLTQYGHSRGKQTYRCGQRQYHFVPGTGRPHQPRQLKAQAVARYAEGSSMAASSRLLGSKEGTLASQRAVKAAAVPAPGQQGSKEGTVYSRVKKARQARELLKLLRKRRQERRPGQPRPADAGGFHCVRLPAVGLDLMPIPVGNTHVKVALTAQVGFAILIRT